MQSEMAAFFYLPYDIYIEITKVNLHFIIMGEYLKLFENHTQYEQYITGGTAVLPNVSHCINEAEVHYNPYVPPYEGFCKLTLANGDIIEIEGSGILTDSMTRPYKSNCVKAEFGTLCTSIDINAFDNSPLIDVNFSSTITSIAMSAFWGCLQLTSLVFPNGITRLGNQAFYGCSNLTSVTLSSSITTIGAQCFQNCSKLENIISLATTAPTIQSITFRNIKINGILTVPSGSSGYDTWMQNANYYLGLYNWTKVEQ